jgi:hypothetical protein
VAVPDRRETIAWIAAIPLAVTLALTWYLGVPWLAFVLMVCAACAAMVLRYHAGAVPLVCFAFYVNLPVVAVKFHHVPSALAKLALAPLLIPIVYYTFLRNEGILVTRTLGWLGLFIGIQWWSALASSNPEMALEAVLTSVLEGAIVYGLITNAVRERMALSRSLWALLLAGAFMGSVSLVQQVTGTFHKNYGGFGQVAEGDGFRVEQDRGAVYQRRLAGPIGEQNRYAQIMLMVVPLGGVCAVQASGRSTKYLAIAATALTASGCALTFSRGAAVAAGLTVIAAACLGLVTKKQFGLLVLLGLATLMAIPQYRTRLATLTKLTGANWSSQDEETGPDGAVRGRATEMLAAAKMFLDHPLLGVGPDLSQLETRTYGMEGGMRALEGNRKTHCLYLELAAELGLPGLACFCWLVWSVLRRLYDVRSQFAATDPFLYQTSTGFLLAIISYLACGIFLHFSYVRYFWFMIAMADSVPTIAAASATTTPEKSSYATSLVA